MTNATTSSDTTRISDPRVRCSKARLGCWRGRAVFCGVRSGRIGAPAGRPVRTLPVLGVGPVVGAPGGATGRYPPVAGGGRPGIIGVPRLGVGVTTGPVVVMSWAWDGHPGELGLDDRPGRRSILGSAGEQLVDQRGQAVRQRGAQSSEVRRVTVEAGQCGVGVGLAEERDATGEALVQHQPQRVQVGSPVELAAADLLGRQVLGRAHHDVVAGEVVAGGVGEALGDAEVGEQDAPVRGDQDVAGLDVAVDQAGLVGGVERGGDAAADVHRQVRAEPLLLVEQLAQALAVDQLHDHGLAAAVGDGVVDGHDVRVVQPGDGDGLTAEPLGDDRVGGQRRLEQLDGHVAGQQRVVGQPHLGHASLRETSLQPVTLGEHRGRQRWRAGGSGHVRSRTLLVRYDELSAMPGATP